MATNQLSESMKHLATSFQHSASRSSKAIATTNPTPDINVSRLTRAALEDSREMKDTLLTSGNLTAIMGSSDYDSTGMGMVTGYSSHSPRDTTTPTLFGVR